MVESSTPLIEHIPRFLVYLKEKEFSVHTQENYKRYLQKFIYWLKDNQKTNVRPHELTNDDIRAYCLYLSQFRDEKDHSLKKITQNYYLIALRALLGYFTAKDVVCLPPDKIALPGGIKRQKVAKFLNLDQIERLLSAPNTKTKAGLRDRAILETLICSGLKVNQLTKLNRNQLNVIPGKALPLVEEYLKSRQDNNRALFINYRSRKDADKRLTARSIERITNKYGTKIGLSQSVTPEILRLALAFALSNKEVKIRAFKEHGAFLIEDYSPTALKDEEKEKPKLQPSSWKTVEDVINKEINWLKDNIPTLPEGYKENPPFLKCDECIIRKIAILIVGGEIKATEFKAQKDKELRNNLTEKPSFKKASWHGQEWHKKMMETIYRYFKSRNYEVVFEPTLNYGRADLGISFNSKKPIYIEVGTVSLFKLWFNFLTMKNSTFLIVPSENFLIEFNT